jgi:HPt (histidine-containing phosphotransfer) domain-containing protein
MRQADLHNALDRLEIPENHHSGEHERSLIAALSEICGGDEDFARELAMTFLGSAPGCLSGIDHALQVGDYRELCAQAHALKGISRTIGAEKLARACAGLEVAGNRKDLEAATHEAEHLGTAWDEVKIALEDYLVVESKI